MMIASTGKVNYFKLVLCSILIHMSCAIFYLLCNALHSFHFNPLRIFRFTYCFFFNFFLQAPKENWLSYHFLIKNSLTYCELHTLWTKNGFFIYFLFLYSSSPLFIPFNFFFWSSFCALYYFIFKTLTLKTMKLHWTCNFSPLAKLFIFSFSFALMLQCCIARSSRVYVGDRVQRWEKCKMWSQKAIVKWWMKNSSDHNWKWLIMRVKTKLL